MNTLGKIARAIVQKIPGSVANVAMEKRQLEKELRAQGYGRKAAMIEASRRFRERG